MVKFVESLCDEVDSDLERDISRRESKNHSPVSHHQHIHVHVDGEYDSDGYHSIYSADSYVDSNVQAYAPGIGQADLTETKKKDLEVEEAENLIGGSDIGLRSHTHSMVSIHGTRSIYEDDKAPKSTTVSGSKTQTFDSDNIADAPSNNVFNFSLPFGGNSISAKKSPLSSLKTMLSADVFTEDCYKKEEIRSRLQRQDSISTLDEITMYKDERGMDNVRTIALKESLQMDSLKNTIKGITRDIQRLTGDEVVQSRLETIYDELEGDIIIMGGYRGSVLRDSLTGKRLWIPLKAGLNMRKVDLVLGPRRKDEVNSEKQVVPDGMLTSVGPVDIAKKLIRKLEENRNVHVHEFGYDWRLSLDITAKKLRDKLKVIKNKQKVKKGVFIIAHSMGGLVAHKVLQEDTDLIRGIIYVGSPSQCPNILGPLRFGDEIMLNKKVLSDEANFFMRSSFTFLPMDGRCFVDKTQRKRYDLDFFDPEVWVELGLSPLVSKKRKEYIAEQKASDVKSNDSSIVSVDAVISGSQKLIKTLNPISIIKNVTSVGDTVKIEEDTTEFNYKTSYEDSYKYLERTLKDTKQFLKSLEYIEGKEYPPLAIVYGNQVPTVRGAKVDGLQDVIDGKYFDFYYGPGDGVVHHHWLLPERRGFPVVAKVASPTGHVSLLGDLESIAEAFIGILDSEKSKEKSKSSKSTTLVKKK
ncbi:hypothetical protein Kpol_2000p31 [Vanderwaltozyma polyspora DSM 70294]|uniref:Uncharacterized protein n=1 Tax=Vanderwaltozyma polyspora (strain ATCC 22028 / DSM 70294 / BCRC 21397 / CBS 2163 / NBRC 10782 / NRRL Y-8283 / UCD 57-17) TaxID=436907 RepID=A7TF41_VANPO|nr:uncharacterized protein Kpol_2000p31 [Vanderwaltozyma polyspora DSM 70294]EDO19066.1 hypothetical protein Kpol_2000p31 [Vanderwaltozyma polyspora DSM 70294]